MILLQKHWEPPGSGIIEEEETERRTEIQKIRKFAEKLLFTKNIKSHIHKVSPCDCLHVS